MAPEIYNDEIFDRSVDAYSFGVILYEVLRSLTWQAGCTFLFPSYVLLLFSAKSMHGFILQNLSTEWDVSSV